MGSHPSQGMYVVELRASVPKGDIPLDMWSFAENLWDPDPSKRLTAEMALGWMETKAQQEGVDTGLAPPEEEWEWKGPHDDKCLWSVSLRNDGGQRKEVY